MVGKNFKYVVLLCGALAVAPAPLAADSGRKLGAFQKMVVALAGVQADQATFGMVVANHFLTSIARSMSALSEEKKVPFIKLLHKVLIRFLNAQDGIVDAVVKGGKDALLTGTAEDLIKEYAGRVPDFVKTPELRNSKTDLSTALKSVCAALAVARSAYIMRTTQTILTQVEDECKKLGIESGVQKGLLPPDDSYLVIDNPFKSLSMGAKKAVGFFDAYEISKIDLNKWFEEKKDQDRYNREALAFDIQNNAKYNSRIERGEWQALLEKNKAVQGFVDKWTGDTDRDEENKKRVNPLQQKLKGVLWAPLAVTHFVGRTMVPYDTIKQLSPELQQQLLDLVALNTVNFYSFWV